MEKPMLSTRRRKRTKELSHISTVIWFALAVTCGVMFGFNIRDLTIRTCNSYSTLALRAQLNKIESGLKPFTGNSDNTLIKPKLVFMGLPAKYLKNQPAQKPAVAFPLRPWRYMEESNKGRHFMTFFIKTAAGYAGRRFLIRQTWGSIIAINGEKFGIVFLVGMVRNPLQQNMLNCENDLYGDILQSDVPDDYFNLPNKVLSGFQWMTYESGDVSDFYATTDDDCVINVPMVYDYFRENINEKRKWMHCGYMYDNLHVPIRMEDHKWGISKETYSGNLYPTFCHGAFTIASFNTFRDIYWTSETTNYTGMQLEDVLISGILREKTYNVSRSIFYRQPLGMRAKVKKVSIFVWHIGLSKNFNYAYKSHWYDLKRRVRLGSSDHMSGKYTSAYRLNASIAEVRKLPNMRLNQTIQYFTTFWQDSIPNLDDHLPAKSLLHKEDKKAQLRLERNKESD